MKNKKTKRKGKTNKMGNFGIIKNKIIFVGIGLLVIAIGIVIIMRFSTPEDSWICTKAGWVKHGNPTADMPKIGCVIPVRTP
jgi:hypothetical protein